MSAQVQSSGWVRRFELGPSTPLLGARYQMVDKSGWEGAPDCLPHVSLTEPSLKMFVTSDFPTESHRNGFLSIVALFIAAPSPIPATQGEGPITLFPPTETVQDTPIGHNNQ